MSVLFASIGIGLVLGWAGAPRPLAMPLIWLFGLAAVWLIVMLTAWASPALAGPTLSGAAVGWSVHTLWLGALSLKNKGS